MENRIREHVEDLFRDAPNNQRIYELKVELIQNLMDKYYDLVGEGKSPEDAYNLTILGIGDVEELIASVEEPTVIRASMGKKKTAFRVSIAVMLYILSVVPVILFAEAGINAVYGVVIMFVMIAAATGLIIYNSMSSPHKKSRPETVVEDFKQWQNKKSGNNAVYKAIMSAFWPLCLALYFVLSFTTGRWNVTWIIFLIAPAVSGIIKAVFDLKNS